MEEYKEFYIGVKLPGTEKTYFFTTIYEDLNVNDFVVVETISGLEMATVSVAPRPLAAYDGELEMKPISRRPTVEDLNDFKDNLVDAQNSMKIAQEEANLLHLEMNFVDAHYTLDGSKITLTYTADERVDFRELLKVLASALHCRIDLRQIVSRDKAKLIGGIGICGLPLCCSTFLTQFEGISLNKAKNQMLALNIQKLSGPCGKLVCCLDFEDKLYTDAKKEFPMHGQVIRTPEGEYNVESFNIISRKVTLVNSARDDFKTYTLDEIKAMQNGTYKKKDPLAEVPPSFTIKEEKPNNQNPENQDRRNHFRNKHHNNHRHGFNNRPNNGNKGQ